MSTPSSQWIAMPPVHFNKEKTSIKAKHLPWRCVCCLYIHSLDSPLCHVDSAGNRPTFLSHRSCPLCFCVMARIAYVCVYLISIRFSSDCLLNFLCHVFSTVFKAIFWLFRSFIDRVRCYQLHVISVYKKLLHVLNIFSFFAGNTGQRWRRCCFFKFGELI